MILAAQRDGHGLHTATARTPAAQGFTIGAIQCRLLRLVGLVLGGMLGGRPHPPNRIIFFGFFCIIGKIQKLPNPTLGSSLIKKNVWGRIRLVRGDTSRLRALDRKLGGRGAARPRGIAGDGCCGGASHSDRRESPGRGRGARPPAGGRRAALALAIAQTF